MVSRPLANRRQHPSWLVCPGKLSFSRHASVVGSTAARRRNRVPWGWRHSPEGHREDSRPTDAREREQLSRSSGSFCPPAHRGERAHGDEVGSGKPRSKRVKRPSSHGSWGWSRLARTLKSHQQTLLSQYSVNLYDSLLLVQTELSLIRNRRGRNIWPTKPCCSADRASGKSVPTAHRKQRRAVTEINAAGQYPSGDHGQANAKALIVGCGGDRGWTLLDGDRDGSRTARFGCWHECGSFKKARLPRRACCGEAETGAADTCWVGRVPSFCNQTRDSGRQPVCAESWDGVLVEAGN
jgi:hypothetical protein